MQQTAIDLSAGSFFLLDSDVYDADVFIGLVRLGIDFYIWDSLNDFHPFGNSSKNGVFVVKPRLCKIK